MLIDGVDIRDIKAELARQGLKMWELGAKMNLGQSTLSTYINGRVKPPSGFIREIESVLGLKDGDLKKQTNKRSK